MSFHYHADPVLIETTGGKFGFFMNGRITSLMHREEAEKLYPRGVQVADLHLCEGCLYCAHAMAEEAAKPRVEDADFRAYFGEAEADKHGKP